MKDGTRTGNPVSRLLPVLEAVGWTVAILLAATRLDAVWSFLFLTGTAYYLLAFKHSREHTAAYLAAVALLPLFLDANQTNILFLVALYATLGIGLNIVVGYAGLLDLGYVAFFAIGAYYYAMLASPFFNQHWPFLVLLPTAMLAAAVAGVLLGIPVLRMRGDYLAIVTLGFGEIIRILLLNLTGFTNGPNGIIRIDRPVLFGQPVKDVDMFLWAALVAVVAAAFCAERLRDSRIGRAWEAMREDEDVAQAMGINTTLYKLLAFGTGAAIGGLGGTIFAFTQGNVFPSSFTLDISIRVLCIVIIGGMGSIPGVILGSFMIVGLPEVLRDVAIGPFQPAEYRMVIFGALLVAMMVIRPTGFVASRRRQAELAGLKAGITCAPGKSAGI